MRPSVPWRSARLGVSSVACWTDGYARAPTTGRTATAAREKKWRPQLFPALFSFRPSVVCWLPLLLPPWQELENSADEMVGMKCQHLRSDKNVKLVVVGQGG